MLAVMKNTFAVFKTNKEFIMTIVFQPVLLFLLMSVLLPYTKEHSIGVCNESSYESSEYIVDSLNGLDGVRVEEVKKKDLNDKLMNSNIEVAVVIMDNPETNSPVAQVITVCSSEIETAVEAVVMGTNLDKASDNDIVHVNKVKKKGINISTTLAFMIFKTLTSAMLLGNLIIVERRNKIRDRIFLSGISKGAYLAGMSAVYFLSLAFGTTLFFVIGHLFNFDFGMKYTVGYLIMMWLADLLAVAISLCASALVKTEDSLWVFGSFIIMPMALFSGLLFPYEFMPKSLKVIGACFPNRWIAKGIEIMQRTGGLVEAVPYMLMLLALCIVLFAIATVKTKRVSQS